MAARPRLAGHDAIDRHVDAAHGEAPARRWVPKPAHTGQGPSPLAEVTGHWVTAPMAQPGAARHHWHLVTRGLSQLGEADAGAEVLAGGWGFELSMRVVEGDPDPQAEREGEGEGVAWAVDLLTNLAAYVWKTGHPFAAGHHLDLRGPMRIGHQTAITAAAVVDDPGLEPLAGPFGPVEFLQVVGLSADELELCRAWSTAAVIELLARDDRWLVTDLGRPSLLDDPVIAAEVAARAGAEGSELTALHIATLSLRRGRFGRGGVLQLGSGAAAALGPALRRELVAAGASFEVVGDSDSVRFVVTAEGEAAGWSFDAAGPGGLELVVRVPAPEVAGVAALFDGRTGWGRRPCLPGLRVRVVA